MKIDNVHSIEEIKQFAGQLRHFNEQVLKDLSNAFNKDREGIDFYLGILSGLSSAYSLLKQDTQSDQLIIDKMGALIAYTAKIIEDRI